jgi:hypothetical protein
MLMAIRRALFFVSTFASMSPRPTVDQRPQGFGFLPASSKTDPIFAMDSAIAFVELMVAWVSFK